MEQLLLGVHIIHNHRSGFKLLQTFYRITFPNVAEKNLRLFLQ